MLKLLSPEFQKRFSLILDLSACGLMKPYQALAEGGFSAAGLTDNAESFSLINIDGHIAQRVEYFFLSAKGSGTQFKILGQISDFQNNLLSFLHSSPPFSV